MLTLGSIAGHRVEALQVTKRSFDLSRTSLDSSKGMILQETSDELGWAGLHTAIVERSPVDRVISGAACLWINMALAEAIASSSSTVAMSITCCAPAR